MDAVTNEAIGIAERFVRIVEDSNIPLERAILFGSHAGGTACKWSDIDIVLVSPAFSGIPFYDNKMLVPFMLKVDSRIEVHPYRPEDFTEEDLFVKEIIKTGVEVKV